MAGYQQQPQQPAWAAQPQQFQQLPVPTDRLIYPMLDLSYGQLPFQPNIQASQAMANWVPLIAMEAIAVIQAEAQTNALRVFLFNTMAANGFQNQEFMQFLQNLMRLVEMSLAVAGYGKQPQQVIKECAAMYCQFKAADSVNKYGALLQGMRPEIAQACQETLQRFIQHTQQLEAALQQRQQPQQMGWGSPMGQPQQPAWGAPIGGRMSMQPTQQQPQQFGFGNSSTGIFQGGANQNAQSWANERMSRYDEYVPQSAPELSPSLCQQQPSASDGLQTFGAAAPQELPTATWEQLNPPRQNDTQETLPPPKIIRSPNDSILEPDGSFPKGGFVFIPTPDAKPGETVPDVYPSVPPVFNPNTSYVREVPDPRNNGKTCIAVFRKETPVDRDQHLAVPVLSSTWTEPVKMDVIKPEVVKSSPDTPVRYEQLDVQMATSNDKASYTDLEHWADNDIQMQLAKTNYIKLDLSKSRRRIMVAKIASVVEPVVSDDDSVKQVADVLSEATRPEQAVAVLKAVKDKLDENPNPAFKRAFAVIDKRLTKSVNYFIGKEAALSSGQIDSYFEDAVALSSFLGRKFGETVENAYREKHSLIIKRALTCLDLSDTTFAANYLGLSDEQLSEIGLVVFAENNVYANLDMSSQELQADAIAKNVNSCGIHESENALLYGIAHGLFAKYNKDASARIYLRTSDEKTYEIVRGAFNPNFLMLYPFDE